MQTQHTDTQPRTRTTYERRQGPGPSPLSSSSSSDTPARPRPDIPRRKSILKNPHPRTYPQAQPQPQVRPQYQPQPQPQTSFVQRYSQPPPEEAEDDGKPLKPPFPQYIYDRYDPARTGISEKEAAKLRARAMRHNGRSVPRRNMPDYKIRWSNNKIDRLMREADRDYDEEEDDVSPGTVTTKTLKNKAVGAGGGGDSDSTLVDQPASSSSPTKPKKGKKGKGEEEETHDYVISKYQEPLSNGFQYVVGDPNDRLRAGIGSNLAQHNSVLLSTSVDISEWPMWYFMQWEHLRPWHVEGEMITRHYDKEGYLLAVERGYATVNKVLDALTNDEFVPRPPIRESLDWEAYFDHFIEPLLLPAREGQPPPIEHNIYTGRYWGEDEEDDKRPKPQPEQDQPQASSATTSKVEGPNGEAYFFVSMNPKEQKPFWKRAKEFYRAHFHEPDEWKYKPTPYNPTKDWEAYARDIEQNRLEMAIERQKSFDGRFRKVAKKVEKKRVKEEMKDRREWEEKQRVLEMNLGEKCLWRGAESDHHAQLGNMYTTGC